MDFSNEWSVGDMFTTPETGDRIFTVSRVLRFDVEAPDSISRAGYSVFTKSWITKVWEVQKMQSEKEIEKYDTLSKIVDQLESCNYENEAGCLKNNVAFISLKIMSKSN